MSARILCVESSAEERAIFCALLTEYEVVTAASAADAIMQINRGPAFDLYILDYWLPDMNGRALCAEILKEDPSVPVVFCTRAARDEDRARALRKGAAAYLLKPVHPPQLIRQVGSLVRFAGVQSGTAQIPAETAVRLNLSNYADRLRERTPAQGADMRATLRRTSHSKALRAYLDHKGTRACFARWWPSAFERLLEECPSLHDYRTLGTLGRFDASSGVMR